MEDRASCFALSDILSVCICRRCYSRTPYRDFRCFYPFEIILSHIPMHAVPHRYPCKSNVTVIQDKLHVACWYWEITYTRHCKRMTVLFWKLQVELSIMLRHSGKFLMLKIQGLKLAHAWYKVKLCIFTLTFIQCFEHVECIAIDIFWRVGQWVTECTRMESLADVVKETHFPNILTIPDKVVIVNLFCWNNHLFTVV